MLCALVSKIFFSKSFLKINQQNVVVVVVEFNHLLLLLLLLLPPSLVFFITKLKIIKFEKSHSNCLQNLNKKKI